MVLLVGWFVGVVDVLVLVLLWFVLLYYGVGYCFVGVVGGLY